jgi:hypothetical protein
MELVIQDNGRAFNPEKARSQEAMTRGLGLLSFSEGPEFPVAHLPSNPPMEKERSFARPGH